MSKSKKDRRSDMDDHGQHKVMRGIRKTTERSMVERVINPKDKQKEEKWDWRKELDEMDELEKLDELNDSSVSGDSNELDNGDE